MQILKHQQLIENTWKFLPDDAEIPDQPIAITISLKRWIQEQEILKKYPGKLGIRLNPDDSLDSLSSALKKVQLIEINFPTFTDGRGFSFAQKLRTQFNYEREIRAVGEFMLDQIYYLSRVGVNSFALENRENLPDVMAMLNEFSDSYQTSVN
jgi:uncharacterized protein (DUF934 family)